MNRLTLLVLLLLLSLSLSVSFSFAKSQIPNPKSAAVLQHPFFFTENKGQWDSRVLYKCNARNGMTWFLERNGITLLISVPDSSKPAMGRCVNFAASASTFPGGIGVPPVSSFQGTADFPVCMQKHPPRYPMKSHALKFKFLAASPQSPVTGNKPTDLSTNQQLVTGDRQPASARSVEPQGELEWHNNYFLGNDSSKWAPNCRNYTNIVYRDVWDGIDIEWYEENGKLEFDFVVQPGADPSQIRMSCDGLEGDLSVDSRGGSGTALSLRGSEATKQSHSFTTPSTGQELRFPTSLGELRTALPQVYQISPGGSRSEVDAKFEITNKNEFGITLPNGYQKEHILRIDPLIYSTYLGGSGGEYEFGQGMILSVNDEAVVAGYSLSANYPITPGVIDTLNENGDCVITKLNSQGTGLVYSTFLGGSSNDEGWTICSDGDDGVIIAGRTASSNFPTTNGSGFNGGSYDCFVTRLNNGGNQILFSTTLGGFGNEEGSAIVDDGEHGCYVTGFTTSANFPTSTSAYSRTILGTQDCFVAHINNNASQLLASTLIGGTGSGEHSYMIARNDDGITIGGYTDTSTFPTTTGAFDTVFQGGGTDCFVTKFDTVLTHLIYSTFLGGTGMDSPWDIIPDHENGIFVVGVTSSHNFPTTPGAYRATPSDSGISFITHFNSTGTQLVASTYFGGVSACGIRNAVRESDGSIWIAGSTRDLFPVSANGLDTTYNGGSSDAFVAKLDSSCSQLLYSTFLGGSVSESVQQIQSDPLGNIIVMGTTISPDFPVSQEAFDTSYNGGGDYFITKIQFSDSTSIVSERSKIPNKYALTQNYPNPFNSSTTIEFSLPKSTNAKLELFDLLGRKVSTLINLPQNAGVHHVRFDGKNLASGEYFYHLSTTDFTQTRKLLLLK